jgi:hypothetical protein
MTQQNRLACTCGPCKAWGAPSLESVQHWRDWQAKLVEQRRVELRQNLLSGAIQHSKPCSALRRVAAALLKPTQNRSPAEALYAMQAKRFGLGQAV